MKSAPDRDVYTCLNQASLRCLMETQRRHGREYLPRGFRQEWAAVHAESAAVMSDPNFSSLAREMARVLFAATFFVGTVQEGTPPNYYQYIDGQLLDWCLELDIKETDDATQGSLNGIHAILSVLRDFEARSLAGSETFHRAYFDETQIGRRLVLIDQTLEKTRSLGATGIKHGMDLDAPLESFTTSPSRLNALIHFTGIPLTVNHDEVMFIRILQASELAFLGIRVTVSATIEAIKIGALPVAIEQLRKATQFAQLLKELLRVLRTMPVSHFSQFRLLTGNASALQSIGFHLMDTLLHGVNTQKLEHLQRIEHLKAVLRFCDQRFVSLKQALLLTDEAQPEWKELWAVCRQLDKDLLTWRGLHLGFAKLYIPHGLPGTGGTSGAQYLKQHLFRGIFDDHEPDWDAVRNVFPELEPPGQNRVKPGLLVVP